MGGHFKWLPCCRKKQQAKEKARRQEEAEQARHKNENNEASGPNTVGKPTVEPKGPQPAIPTPAEEIGPSLSIHQQVWNEAYDLILKDEPNLVEGYMKALKKSMQPEDAPDPEDPDISAEMNDPIKREETMKSLVQSGQERVKQSAEATERVGKFANGILSCKSIIDLAVQSVPQAALPWAGVCIGLQILGNPAAEFKFLREGITHVTSRMEWYCSMTEHMLSEENLDLGHESYKAVLGQLRKKIVALYQELLLYQMRSICSFYRKRGLEFLRGLISLDGWEGQLQGVKDAEKSLLDDSNHYNNQYAKTAMGSLVRQGEEARDALGNINQTLRDYISGQKFSDMDNDRKECLRAIHAVDPQDTIIKIEETRDRALRVAYEWVLKTEEYKNFIQWTDKEKNRALWVNGPAGTGKTMLLIGMIGEMGAAPAAYTPSMSYFFCEQDNDQVNTPTAALRTLIWMLLIQQPHLFSHVLQEFKTYGVERYTDTNAFFFLLRIFTAMLKDPKLERTYLIVDALDECTKKAADGANLDTLKNLIHSSFTWTYNVKWLITSRPEVAMDKCLRDLPPGALAQIDVQGQSGAVQAYIDHKISQLDEADYTDKIKAELSQELRERCNGIFLWVALVFRTEIKKWAPSQALEALKGLPSDLTKLYANLLSRIEEQGGNYVNFCRDVLIATCLVRRPLSLQELSVCAGVPTDIPIAYITPKCGSFIAIKNGTVYPIHQSAREYLQRHYLPRVYADGVRHGHLEIFRRSIQYMNANLKANMWDLTPGTTIEQAQYDDFWCRHTLYPIQYSCEYWVDHLLEAYTEETQELELSDTGKVFEFLQRHLLHWLESLVLMGNFSAGIRSIRRLSYRVGRRTELWILLQDAEKFGYRFRLTIEGAPLQIYGFPLVLSPTKSKIREFYWKDRLSFIDDVKGVQNLWDSCLQTLESGEAYALSMMLVGFSPDGKTLATASERNIRLWDIDYGALIKEIKYWNSCFRFSPDSKKLTLVSYTRGTEVMEVWDLTAATDSPDFKKKLWNISGEAAQDTSRWSTCTSIAPDGCTIARGFNDGGIEIWDATTGSCKELSKGHDGRICTLEFSPSGDKLVSAAYDGTLMVWDTVTGTRSRVLVGPGDLERSSDDHRLFGFGVAFSPDGKTLASVHASTNGIVLWNMNNGDSKVLVKNHRDAMSVAFSTDGYHIASGEGPVIKLFNASTGAYVKSLVGHSREITSLAFSPTRPRLASASWDDKGKLWDTVVINADDPVPVEVSNKVYDRLALSQDGKLFAMGSHENEIILRDTTTGDHTRTFDIDDGIAMMAFSPDGKFFAASLTSGVQLWNLITGSANEKIDYVPDFDIDYWGDVGEVGYCGITFSPDGKLLAIANNVKNPPNIVSLVDTATGQKVRSLESPSFLGALAISPDNKVVATDRSHLTFWDVSSGSRSTFPSSDRIYYPSRIRFSDDGQHLSTSRWKKYSISGELEEEYSTRMFDIDEEWIIRDGVMILWLPSQYTRLEWASSDNGVILMDASGRYVMFHFKFA